MPREISLHNCFGSQSRIKDFVRKSLGCQCPEEVFQHIECACGYALPDGAPVKARINIGNRLLIYVLDMVPGMDMGRMLQFMVQGRGERDRMGFNRFRLVLLSDEAAYPLSALRQLSAGADGRGSSYEDVTGLDDKIHAHIMPRDEFSILDKEG